MNEHEKIAAIHDRLQEKTDGSWTEIAIATAMEYGRSVRNQTLEEAANKVKALSCGLDCDCDVCVARKNDVATILELRIAEPSNADLSHRASKH